MKEVKILTVKDYDVKKPEQVKFVGLTVRENGDLKGVMPLLSGSVYDYAVALNEVKANLAKFREGVYTADVVADLGEEIVLFYSFTVWVREEVEEVETATIEGRNATYYSQKGIVKKLDYLTTAADRLGVMVSGMLQRNDMTAGNFVDVLDDYAATRATVKPQKGQPVVNYRVSFRDGSVIKACVYVTEETITWGACEDAVADGMGRKLWGQAMRLFEYIAAEDENEERAKKKKRVKRINALLAAARRDLGRAWFSGHYEWIASGIPF